jgi:hypothetical protein
MAASNREDDDAEFNAMRAVHAALKDLDRGAQTRVLDYVCQRLSLNRQEIETHTTSASEPTQAAAASPSFQEPPAQDDELEGISPVARKWMKRSGLTSAQLSSLFSLGVDEIDLVASSVPGKSRAERVRSVLLLQGIAAYLGSGAARVSDEKLREACSHYDAYDGTNFTKHLRAVAAEASGTRESGYTLTSRGIAAATELIKQMVASA